MSVLQGIVRARFKTLTITTHAWIYTLPMLQVYLETVGNANGQGRLSTEGSINGGGGGQPGRRAMI